MSNISSIESFIEEIKADFRKFSDGGLLDEASIYRDIVNGIKRFGNDVQEVHETVIYVENGKAVLPEGFMTLYIAYLCEPIGYSGNNIEKHHLQDSNFYIEKTERDVRWDSCDPCCTTENEKVITEKLFFKDIEIDFNYGNPQLLRLGKSFNKNSCHNKCRNKFVTECPYEIIINKDVLYTNFDCGSIYLQYYGLPKNEEGELIMPHSFNGHIEEFLEYHVKERVAERLIASGEAQGLGSLYTIYAQKKSTALRNAMAEQKMGSLNPDRLRRRWSRLNRAEALTYSLNF